MYLPIVKSQNSHDYSGISAFINYLNLPPGLAKTYSTEVPSIYKDVATFSFNAKIHALLLYNPSVFMSIPLAKFPYFFLNNESSSTMLLRPQMVSRDRLHKINGRFCVSNLNTRSSYRNKWGMFTGKLISLSLSEWSEPKLLDKKV